MRGAESQLRLAPIASCGHMIGKSLMIGLKRNRGWSSVNVHDVNHMSSEVFCVYAVGDRLDMRAPKCSGWGWPQLHHAAVPSASQQGRPVALSAGHGSVHCCGPGPHRSPQEADQGCASHSALYHQGEPHRQDYILNSLQPTNLANHAEVPASGNAFCASLPVGHLLSHLISLHTKAVSAFNILIHHCQVQNGGKFV